MMSGSRQELRTASHQVGCSPASSNRISDDSDDEAKAFLHEWEAPATSGVQLQKLRRHRYLTAAIVLNSVWFLLSTGLFLTWYRDRSWGLNGDLRRVAAYSPILDRLDLDVSTKKVNGTLFPQLGASSIARQMPNPEAEELWDEYERGRVVAVTRADLVAMNADPEITVKLEDEVWGLGDDAYAAAFDVYHQIHCLNALRKTVYTAYYDQRPVSPFNMTLSEIHINHCVDILLQGLKCNANVSLMPMEWHQTQRWPFPQMSVEKKCVNFDRLTEFRKSSSLDWDKWLATYFENRPESLVQGPPPPGWVEFYGEDARRKWLTRFPEGRNASSVHE